MIFFRRHFSKIIILVLGISVGLFAGWNLFRNLKTTDSSSEISQIRNAGKYKFINPLVECDIQGQSFLQKYIPFEAKITNEISQIQTKHPNVHLSMYFRNLNNGPWFGINELEDFAPASLLKLPLMMAYFKESESEPDLLNKSITYNGDNFQMLSQNVKPDSQIEIGKTYTVSDLINRMVIYSDNAAFSVLYQNFPQGKLYQIYSDIGIPNPYASENENAISVKDYASFFRMLYNAAYLDQENSEKALSILAQSDYKDGLVVGVPANIPVAHKFGERSLEGDQFSVQRHDCGIIYYAKYPYLLCIMTKGNDPDELTQMISSVSQITFKEISKDYP